MPLPKQDQREFEEMLREAQTASTQEEEVDLALHPDARKPVVPDFEGEVNPATGEHGGPKKEPVAQWTEEGGNSGDWSFKGRVSDF